MTKHNETQQTLKMIADDMAADATRFDGQPFNGRTVAEYLGNQGAAIAAIARILARHLDDTTPHSGGRS